MNRTNQILEFKASKLEFIRNRFNGIKYWPEDKFFKILFIKRLTIKPCYWYWYNSIYWLWNNYVQSIMHIWVLKFLSKSELAELIEFYTLLLLIHVYYFWNLIMRSIYIKMADTIDTNIKIICLFFLICGHLNDINKYVFSFSKLTYAPTLKFCLWHHWILIHTQCMTNVFLFFTIILLKTEDQFSNNKQATISQRTSIL